MKYGDVAVLLTHKYDGRGFNSGSLGTILSIGTQTAVVMFPQGNLMVALNEIAPPPGVAETHSFDDLLAPPKKPEFVSKEQMWSITQAMAKGS